MTNRSRIRTIGLVATISSILLLPFAFKLSAAWQIASLCLFSFTGFTLVRDSFGEGVQAKWAYLLGVAYSGFAVWDFAGAAWNGFRGFGFRSLATTASGLFAAWCAILIGCILMGMLDKKTKFEDSMSVPFTTTAWALGGVATLSGLNQIFSLRLDGFFGTIAAAGFALAVLGLGILLLKGKQAHLACWGLGLVTSASMMWTLFTHSTLKAVMLMSSTTLAFYGFFAAIGFASLVGTWALGTEVLMANKQKK